MSDTLDIVEATLCISHIAGYARAENLSDAALVRRFSVLGSARSWRRLAAHDWAIMPLDVWLPKLKAVYEQLKGLTPEAARESAPVALVTRHLHEADQCRRENHLALARSHCRTARRAIEDFTRTLAPKPTANPP